MLGEMKVKEFVMELASDSPAPGGGSAAALSGALGAGLVAMVCRLTVGKIGYEEVQDVVASMQTKSDELCQKLTLLIDEDTEAFNNLMAAFQMPKKTEEEKEKRSALIQEAYREASAIPLQVAVTCLEVLKLADMLKDKGNKNAISDIGVAAELAHAGLKGAVLNVEINLPSVKDEEFVVSYRGRIQEIIQNGTELRAEVNRVVKELL